MEFMQRNRVLILTIRITSLLFGVCGVYIDDARAQMTDSPVEAETEVQREPAQDSTNVPETQDDGLWVEVEPTNLLPSDITGIYYLIPYRNRRDKWGQTVSVGYSSFTPINYEPNFITSNFEDIYATADMPLIELQVTVKRNFALGSIGAEFGVGMYQNNSDSDLIESDIQLIPFRLGMNYSIDNLYHEPFVVPYAMAGAYVVMYEENAASVAHGGNTQIAPYFGGGLLLQLNWVDREAARISYLESGIENTFIYLEMRRFIASSVVSDPDFSTGFDWGLGVRLEF